MGTFYSIRHLNLSYGGFSSGCGRLEFSLWCSKTLSSPPSPPPLDPTAGSQQQQNSIINTNPISADDDRYRGGAETRRRGVFNRDGSEPGRFQNFSRSAEMIIKRRADGVKALYLCDLSTASRLGGTTRGSRWRLPAFKKKFKKNVELPK